MNNKADKDKSPGQFKIHNVGFYIPEPRPIKCLSYNKRTSKLAVSRDDASIEIWDMRSAVYMEKCILGRPESSVEALGWLGNRLFSTGMVPELIEWNLRELKPKKKFTLTGVGLCMDIDNGNECIAVGTQPGFLNQFSVDGDDLNVSHPFDKQDGPINCCKYASSGRFIVAGSTDKILIWDATKGHAVFKMSLSRVEKKRAVTVFSLVVLKDLTIIAGDSERRITVWNGVDGTHIDSIDNALDAEVLAVAVNDNETMFCCSGVDPRIQIYEEGGPRKWFRTFRRSVHDHDVKALTFMDEKRIISGGVSGYINVSCSTKDNSYNQCQYAPFLPQPCAVVATQPRLLLLKYLKKFEIWQLGRPSENVQLSDEDGNQKKFLSMEDNQKKLVELNSIQETPITCASISPNGKFLIYSTDSFVRLFQLDVTQKPKPSVDKVNVTSAKFSACTKVLFSSDSKYLYCVKSNGDIEIFSLSYNDDVDFKGTISTKEIIKDTISLICLSKCGKYLVCTGTCGTTAIWTSNGIRWKYMKQIAKQSAAPTAIAIHSKTNRIVLAFSDYKIFEYDLTTDTIVCASDASLMEYLTSKLKNTDKVINNILLDENNENVVILQNDSFLFVLEKAKAPTIAKKLKSQPSNNISSADNYRLRTHLGHYEHFVHMSWLSPSEIVAIVVTPVTLIEQLPAAVVHKMFGVS